MYADTNKPIIHIRDQNTIFELSEKALKNSNGEAKNPYIMDLSLYFHFSCFFIL